MMHLHNAACNARQRHERFIARAENGCHSRGVKKLALGEPAVQRALSFGGARSRRAPVVLVALEHAHSPVEHAGQPERGVGRRALRVAEARVEAVRLHVGLIHRVQAQRGAEGVEALRVGVVRHAHRVEVGLLHEQDVHHHGLLRDDLHAC